MEQDRTLVDTEFEPDDALIGSFEALKTALLNAPILSYPDFTGSPFIVDVDWSEENRTVGGVLSQVQNGTEKVIVYCSLKLSPAQAKYPATKGELAGLIIFLKKWKYYLLGRPFLVRTDHKALESIKKMEYPTGLIQRWLSTLSNFNLKSYNDPERSIKMLTAFHE